MELEEYCLMRLPVVCLMRFLLSDARDVRFFFLRNRKGCFRQRIFALMQFVYFFT